MMFLKKHQNQKVKRKNNLIYLDYVKWVVTIVLLPFFIVYFELK